MNNLQVSGFAGVESFGAVSKEAVSNLQQALNEYYDVHPYYPLSVDGALGSKTCAACYMYNQEYLEEWGKSFTSEFFTSLDLPSSYVSTLGNACTPYYKVYFDQSTGKPTSAQTTAAKDMIKALQTALNAQYAGHANYPLKVDGKFGPKTCAAAYGYKQEVLGDASEFLGSAFFQSLNLIPAATYSNAIGSGCYAYYTQSAGEEIPDPGAGYVKVDPAPSPADLGEGSAKKTSVPISGQVKKAGMGMGASIALVGLVALGAWWLSKRKGKAKTKAKAKAPRKTVKKGKR